MWRNSLESRYLQLHGGIDGVRPVCDVVPFNGSAAMGINTRLPSARKAQSYSRRAFLEAGLAVGLATATASPSLAELATGTRLKITDFKTLLVNNIPPYL